MTKPSIEHILSSKVPATDEFDQGLESLFRVVNGCSPQLSGRPVCAKAEVNNCRASVCS